MLGVCPQHLVAKIRCCVHYDVYLGRIEHDAAS
jgi:hypothetical protein